MRALVPLLLLALLGSLAMPDTLPADEKKETKVKITVKRWDAQGKKFLNPCEVDARRVELKGMVAFFVPGKQAIGTGQPVTGSEITDADGTVYVVKNGTGVSKTEFQATVEKKP